MASISIREGIRWLPAEMSEPTSTVVLTSPERRFVDIRVLYPAGATPAEDIAPIERLDWAIAGTSSSTPRGGPGETHGVWRHWIDSRTTATEDLADEGDMAPMDAERTLETGRMVNPDTGIDTPYEEVWRDPSVSGVEGRKAKCYVLVWDEGPAARGMVIKLGRWCQGIIRDGDDVRAERWEWRAGPGWRRSKRVGDGTGMPCGVLLERDVKLERGNKFEHEGRRWVVAEATTL
ncbi:hypothetical protein ACHAQA_007845 [Verticillium albo-atrum]